MKTNTSEEKSDQIKKQNVPDGLKILSILSMIGSGFWVLICLFLVGQKGSFLIFFIYLCFLTAFVLKFIGALKIYKGKKSGYNIYMIPSIIINLLFIYSITAGFQTMIDSAIILTLLMIMFAVFFYTFKEKLK